MTAALILGAIAWAVIAAMLWFIFGPLLDDQPVARALVALFWPIALVAMIALCFIEALTDAVGDSQP
ncbi:hypothetical protein [Blastomonas fulva]|uniref:hypothetical protein n=1 Tax=Blastomonas fulva TaxID=1550728 RepID=UPI0025A3EAF0|nr:hypothetical protein [Blastomonas fulva]MDM7928665.1 hypothetical protein [Blastomonas fulva]MDM7964451.1 hypothetical protein [Blastomonas fulva]